MCRRTVLDADGVVLDADSATSDADSDDSQPKKAPDASAAELPPEELWQVHGAYYDLTSFAKDHPGGVEQIIAQKGKDCTTLFETVHLFDEQPRKVLRKYYVRDVPDYEPTLVWSGDDFYPTLKRRVKAHFRRVHKEEKHRLYARTHPNMVHHGTPKYHAAMLFFLVGTYVLYVGALAYSSAVCAVLWGLFAFASGGVGHESLHAGTFTTPRRNRIACWFFLDMFGISSFMYQRVHTFGHHLHTNERGADPDIEVHMPGCRLSQHQERLPIHWWQCYMAFPIYGLALPISSLIDCKAVITGGWGHYDYPVPVDHPRPIELAGFVLGKICFVLTVCGPLFACGSWGIAFRQMFLMLCVGSFVVVLTFAVSHQNRKCFQQEEALEARGMDGKPATDFGELQVKTTCDFDAPFWQLLHCGGLGFQIEHHLFPTVSIAHFPQVSKIVMQACLDFGLPYHHYNSWGHAVVAHYEYLKEMGRSDIVFADQPAPVLPCAYPPRPLYAKRWKVDDILYPPHEDIRGRVDPSTGFSADLKYLPGEKALLKGDGAAKHPQPHVD